jgi:UDP-N-acetylglucosamine 2-epimerase (non-hydrolysing)
VTKLKTFLVVGARPNFMKIAPIYKEMLRFPNLFEPIILHTGQHYDEKMSKVFFDDLELPEPDIYLQVGSQSHALQTAEIMKRFETELVKHQPDLVMLVGDVNSTLACSLTAMKIRYQSLKLSKVWASYSNYLKSRKIESKTIKHFGKRKDSDKRPLIAHVEAGLRSFDFDMPEEVNRTVTDLLSDFLFTTCQDGDENLINEGYDSRKVFFVGNVMIDALKSYVNKAKRSTILHELNRQNQNVHLQSHQYILVTLHRPSNVDDPEMLQMILSCLSGISDKSPVIFPMHPRTQKLVKQIKPDLHKEKNNFFITEPIGYLDFLHLQANAKLVITDSGGIQEETSYLGVSCLTLRPNTERPITIRKGTNKLVPLDKESILKETFFALANDSQKAANINLWDGETSKRIVRIFRETLTS